MYQYKTGHSSCAHCESAHYFLLSLGGVRPADSTRPSTPSSAFLLHDTRPQDMATDGPEIDFKHIWKKPSHKNPTGTLICSANALHLSPELGFEEEATDCKPLLIYRSTFEESKDVMDCGKTYKCPSYAGYVTSTSRSRFEVNIAFARKSGHLPAKWQNYSDELVARLYVDGSVEPLEEISKHASSIVSPASGCSIPRKPALS